MARRSDSTMEGGKMLTENSVIECRVARRSFFGAIAGVVASLCCYGKAKSAEQVLVSNHGFCQQDIGARLVVPASATKPGGWYEIVSVNGAVVGLTEMRADEIRQHQERVK